MINISSYGPINETIDWPKKKLIPSNQLELPINDYKENIVRAVYENDEVVISAETGAGKSTKVPQFLYEAWYEVIVTQPRRIAAISLAKHVAREMKTSLWDIVWYHIGWGNHKDKKISPNTGIKFCTDGLQLIQQLVRKNDQKWSNKEIVLLIDEVHERNQNIEILLAWIKKEKQLWRKIKVVIMSATLESNELLDFFSDIDTKKEEKTVPVIDVPWRLFPIQKDVWNIYDMENIVYKLVEEKKNTLIFQPWKPEIYNCINELENKLWDKAIILPLHWELPIEEQEKVFAIYDKPVIIVSTNVAQTSITIPYINAVVDTGLERRIETIDGVESLLIGSISKADTKQRAWRAGRCWPWTYIYCGDDSIDSLNDYPIPEIQRTRLDLNYLRILAKTWYAMEDLEFVHQPKNEDIHSAKTTLQKLWAIDENNNVTVLWKKIVELPVDVHEWCMILQACKEWVLDDILKIAAIKSQWWIIFYGKDWVINPPSFIRNSNSDLISHLNLFNLGLDSRKVFHIDDWKEEDLEHISQEKKWKDRLRDYAINVKSHFRAIDDWKEEDLEHISQEKKWKDRLRDYAINVKSFFRAMEKYKQLKSLFGKELYTQKKINQTPEERETAILKCIMVWMLDNIRVNTSPSSYGNYYQSEPYGTERLVSHRSYTTKSPIVSGEALSITTRRGLLDLLTQINLVKFEWLQEYVPHMTQEVLEDTLRSTNSQEVIDKIKQTFNSMRVSVYDQKSSLSDTSIRVFCKALATWYVYSENEILDKIQKHNIDIKKQLDQLETRTAGHIESFSENNLADYFYEVLHNKWIINTKDFVEYLERNPESLVQMLTLNPPHILVRDYDKILKSYPEQIKVGDKVYQVEYNKDWYYWYRIFINIMDEDIKNISSEDFDQYFEGKKYIFSLQKDGENIKINNIEQYKKEQEDLYKKNKRKEFYENNDLSETIYSIKDYEPNWDIKELCYDETHQLYAHLGLVICDYSQNYYQKWFSEKQEAEENTNRVEDAYQKHLFELEEIKKRELEEERINKTYDELIKEFDMEEYFIGLFDSKRELVEFIDNLKKIDPNKLDPHELLCGRARATSTIYDAFEGEWSFCSVDINDVKYFVHDVFFWEKTYSFIKYDNDEEHYEEDEDDGEPIENMEDYLSLLAKKFTVISKNK